MRSTLIALLVLLTPTLAFASLTSGILEYWRMNETARPSLINAPGFTRSLTIGNPTFGRGIRGGDINFGASNTSQDASTTSTVGISAGVAASFCMWVKVLTAPGSGVSQRIFEQEDAGGNGFFAIYRDSAGTKQMFYERIRNSVADDSCTVTQTLTVGTWYNVCLTYDGATMSGYLNGALQCQKASSGNGSGSSAGFSIGCAVPTCTAGQPFPGEIDEVGVWNRALTANELGTLYNGGMGTTFPFVAFLFPF